MVNIAAKRVSEIEATFRRIKHTLKGNIQGNVEELDKEIDTLAMKVYKDKFNCTSGIEKLNQGSVRHVLF